VIEFSRCFFDGQTLRRGRAYFATDLRFRPELPEASLAAWGDRVLSRIKTQLLRAPELPQGTYAGADALQWIRTRKAVAGGGALNFTADKESRDSGRASMSVHREPDHRR
jgi:hypothetical protein